MEIRVLFFLKNRVSCVQILFYLFFQISYCQNLVDNVNGIIKIIPSKNSQTESNSDGYLNQVEVNSLSVLCPGNFELVCGQDVQAEFNTWINSFGYVGGGNVITTDLSGYVAPQPGETLVVFYLASDNINFDYCKVKFKVPNCDTNYCSYTQGFYGNSNGKGCTKVLGQVSSQEIMKYAIQNHGGSYNFGSTTTGNYFKIVVDDVIGNSNSSSNNIFKMLPGGGNPRPLVNFASYTSSLTWSDGNPLNASGPNMGKINNVLLSQTMTLFFNLEINPNLSNLALEPNFSTAATTFCGSNIPIIESIKTFDISQDLINYLKNNYGEATVGNLFLLANKALGGENIGSLSCSTINNAVDTINRGYDKCRIKVINSNPETDSKNIADFEVSPIPFKDYITVKYLFDNESEVNIQIFDLRGMMLMDINDNNAYQFKEYRIEMTSKFPSKEMFYIQVKTSKDTIVKKIIVE